MTRIKAATILMLCGASSVFGGAAVMTASHPLASAWDVIAAIWCGIATIIVFIDATRDHS